MIPWRLLEYVTDDGRSPFQEWYGTLDTEAQAALDATVLELTVSDDWTDREGRQFRQLTRSEHGLSEIRFWVFGDFEPRKSRPPRRRLRAFGLYRPDQREFIFLGGCEKQRGGLVYIPEDALGLAMKHKQSFEAGRGTTRDYV
jgi:hypothetical protein